MIAYYLPSVKQPDDIREITLSEMKEAIRSGILSGTNYNPLINKIRNGNKELKTQLPQLFFSKFHSRKDEANFEYGEIFLFDADAVPDIDSVERRLIADDKIYFLFRSCTGQGLKFGVKLSEKITDIQQYKLNYAKCKAEFEQKYSFVLDSTISPTVGSYFSIDKDFYVNWASKSYQVEKMKPVTKETKSTAGSGLYAPIGESQRDKELTSRAGLLFQKGLDTPDILSILHNINSTCCYEPLPSKDIEKICNSVSKYNNGKQGEFNPAEFFKTKEIVMQNLNKVIDFKAGALISYPDGTGIIYEGTINTIEGASGSHKSHLAEALISSLIKGISNDVLGLRITAKPVNIILIDSERHKDTQFLYAVQSIRQNAGHLPDNFYCYSLIDIDLADRRKALESSIKKAKDEHPERHTIVVLDTITDFLIDLNSTPEALNLVSYLNQLVNNENCTVIGVIHLNEKGLASGFSTGAIGTHLRRKGTNIIQIKKESDNQYSINIDKTRVTATPPKLFVKYSPERRMLIALDETELQTGYKAKPSELKEYLFNLLQKEDVSRADMMLNVETKFNIKDERTLLERISRINQNDMYLNIQKITKDGKSYYSLKSVNNEII